MNSSSLVSSWLGIYKGYRLVSGYFFREGTEVRSTDYRTILTLVRAGISRGIKLYVFKNISNKMELSLILSTWETVFDY